ncbi:MAG: phage holin family protein [Bacilli bacterium]|nr:phage holin family protein [Bacilli bacterium]MDD4795421.1 phage holin family protein [Bacilli bacterium]
MIIYSEKKKTSMNILELCLTLLINATALILATSIFKGIYISNFWYGILAAAVIMILNKTVKPFIKLLALPITIYTLGLFYPFVNVFILKIAGLLIGKNFIVDGWIAPFFVSIFISLFTIILDALITKQIVGDKK